MDLNPRHGRDRGLTVNKESKRSEIQKLTELLNEKQRGIKNDGNR